MDGLAAGDTAFRLLLSTKWMRDILLEGDEDMILGFNGC